MEIFNIKIEICIPTKETYDIANNIFRDVENIYIVLTSITHASHTAIISPGNSFAEMNGGVDGIINTLLSSYTPFTYIQNDVKMLINNKYCGELPIGHSVILYTLHPKHNILIYTPTMRVAEDVSTTLNAYIAFRSALLLLQQYAIDSASTTLFCTGAGNMDVKTACLQMKEAYLSILNKSLINGDWQIYHTHHQLLKSY